MSVLQIFRRQNISRSVGFQQIAVLSVVKVISRHEKLKCATLLVGLLLRRQIRACDLRLLDYSGNLASLLPHLRQISSK